MSDINFAGYIDDAGERFIGNFQSDGVVGPPGYTPVKGTDYFTEEDITEIKDLVKTETGCEVEMSLDPTTFVLTISLITSDGTILNTETIDLPIEAMIINGSYDSATKTITLTLQSGNTIDIPIGDIISGLQEEITNDNKLSSDLVDDTGHTNKFVTDADKTNWNGKADYDTVVLKSGSTMTGGLTTPTLTVGTRSSGSTVGTNSFAGGYSNTASGSYSYAEGSYSKATGNSSHAEGSYTNATGGSSHAEGSTTTASAYTSHAEGSYTTASANNSHAEGNNTIARRASQHVEGEYNIQDPSGTTTTRGDFVHIVGNGTDSSRSNAHTLDWSGNAWFAGDVYVGSTSGKNKDAGSKKLATDEDVQELETNVQELETKVEELEQENAQLLNAQPTDTATGETINVNDSANLPLKDIQVLGNATQADTPTPTTPQDIHVVTGDNTLTIQSKNLFNSFTKGSGINTTTGAIITNTSGAISDYIPVNFNNSSNYYVSGLTNKLNSMVAAYDSSKQFLGRTGGITRTDLLLDTTSFSNGTPQGTGDIAFLIVYQYYVSGNTGNINDIDNLKVQLEQGSSATSYVPYQKQTITLPLGDIELARIPNTDYKDRIFKAEVGNAFYDSLTTEQKATLTLGKWYVYKAIGKQIWNGTEDWTARYNSVYNNKMLFSTTCPHLKADGISTRFVATNGYTEYYPQGISFRNATDKLGLVLDDTILANYKASDLKAWLAENNTEVRYILATPTITEITDTALITALEQVEAMTTYKTTTNAFTLTVSDNATPTIVMEYRQDIGTYIHRLETLEARVELLEQ